VRYIILVLVFVFHGAVAQKKERPYVILVSFDGFRHDYISKFNLPNFNAFIKKGAAAEGLIPSFPSKTFPNHYTLVTGLYPGNHGLVDNYFYDATRKERYSMRNLSTVTNPVYYGGTPLWQLAQQQGLRSASFFWVGSEAPVQGEFPTYYFPYYERTKNSARIEQAINWLKLPKKERPQFISLYFSLVDTEGHNTGTNSLQLNNTVLQADSLLGQLMRSLNKTKLPVNVIVVSDHGMLELKQEAPSYITLSDLINLSDTSVVTINGGTQAHIYTRHVDSLYRQLKSKEENFVVYKKSMFPTHWHYNNPRVGDLLIVANPGYYIQTSARSFGNIKWPVFGVHGYDAAVVKEMNGIFYAAGPNIKPGTRLEAFENVHIYPFIATLLGLNIPDVDGDGEVLKKLYKK